MLISFIICCILSYSFLQKFINKLLYCSVNLSIFFLKFACIYPNLSLYKKYFFAAKFSINAQLSLVLNLSDSIGFSLINC